jgi:serine O-acetyltransferase
MKSLTQLLRSKLNGASLLRDAPEHVPSHDDPRSTGDTNQNPRDIGFFQLIAEDFRTHGSNPLEPGFWALAAHRLGNARMSLGPRVLRAPLTVAYVALDTGVNWLWGIDLEYMCKVGRRVRIWHHGGIVIGARGIGDDVQIRHSTTIGLAARNQALKRPIIGNRVDIGPGACILGAVTVGDDVVIGANTVVVRDLPKGVTVLGVPARPFNVASESDAPPPPKRG